MPSDFHQGIRQAIKQSSSKYKKNPQAVSAIARRTHPRAGI
jgi:hypothetical protein